MCCLGVGCHVLLGHSITSMRGRALPDHSFMVETGLTVNENVDLVHANDSAGEADGEMSHAEIGMYLYFTAEAGIAGV